jgi:hypothetical protein
VKNCSFISAAPPVALARMSSIENQRVGQELQGGDPRVVGVVIGPDLPGEGPDVLEPGGEQLRLIQRGIGLGLLGDGGGFVAHARFARALIGP